LSELVETTAVFLGSKNREIVKSALGFIKLLTITIDPTLITPHLPSLVPALLGWVHDHKNHFKQKTVHIFERMIRRFGYDAVYKHAPEGGERKVLEGIKKRKDRAKRKKAKAAEDGSDDEPVSLLGQSTLQAIKSDPKVAKTSSGNAFEDILYNSDSESDDDDEEDEQAAQKGRPIKPLAKGKGGKQQQSQQAKEKEPRRDRTQIQTYIRDEGDEPMDLLSRSIAGGVTSE
jgi:ribosomal RNA-processing protein 12